MPMVSGKSDIYFLPGHVLILSNDVFHLSSQWKERSWIRFTVLNTKHRWTMNSWAPRRFFGLEHANRSLEGEGSEACTEDPDYLEHVGGRIADVDVLKLLETILAVWNTQTEDRWRDDSVVVGEYPGSLELASRGSLKRRFWSRCRGWGH